MVDISAKERLCYQYFIENKIQNRQHLRSVLKNNPLPEVTQSFAESMFSAFKNEMKAQSNMNIHDTVGQTEPYKVICINDLHIPFHDEKAVKLVFNFIKQQQPNELILNGDILDCYQQSKFTKDPAHKLYLQDEADMFYSIFSDLRKWIPNTKVSYVLGNHERRIETVTWATPAFYSVEALQIPKLLRCDELKIDVYAKARFINKFKFYHGVSTNQHAGASAKKELEIHCYNPGMTGHTHRLGDYTRTGDFKSYRWDENGCLCDLHPKYIDTVANWQHGFSLILFTDTTHYVSRIEIKDYEFSFGGQIHRL